MILLDYIQRIGTPGEHGDRRGAVDADDGLSPAIRRRRGCDHRRRRPRSLEGRKGRSSYTDGLSLASFRETSELEYGADDAFILAPADDARSEGESSSRVVLKHLKSRHGETKDIALTFDGKHQRFTPAEPAEPTARADSGKLQAALRALWDKTRPAQDDGEADW